MEDDRQWQIWGGQKTNNMQGGREMKLSQKFASFSGEILISSFVLLALILAISTWFI